MHISITTDNEVTGTKVTRPDSLPTHNDSDDGDDSSDEDNEIESIKQCEENPDEDKPTEMEQTTPIIKQCSVKLNRHAILDWWMLSTEMDLAFNDLLSPIAMIRLAFDKGIAHMYSKFPVWCS